MKNRSIPTLPSSIGSIRLGSFVFICMLSVIYYRPTSIKFIPFLLIFIPLIFFILLYQMKAVHAPKKIGGILLILISLLFCYVISILIALWTNINAVIYRDLIDIYRPLCYAQLILLGYYVGGSVDDKIVKRFFFIYLILSLVLGIVQAFAADLVSFLEVVWRAEKLMGAGHKLRVIGFTPNPNAYGITTLIAGIAVYILSDKFAERVLSFFMTISTVLLSGSRSALIITPIAFTIASLGLQKISPKRMIFFFIFLILFSSTLFKVISVYEKSFPYLARLTSITENIEQEGWSSIHKQTRRFKTWERKYTQMQEMGDQVWIFGAGPRKEGMLREVDNEYLFVLFRYGIVGIGLNFTLWVLMTHISIRSMAFRKRLSLFVFVYIMVMFIFGLPSESFSSWTISLPLYFLVGILLGISKMTIVTKKWQQFPAAGDLANFR